MSEEMKAILALIDYLGLELSFAKGQDPAAKVDTSAFARDNPEFEYTVQEKP